MSIEDNAKKQMEKTVDSFKDELTKLRTGRAHPSLLDHVSVLYYGNPTPLAQVASISVSDAQTLAITPWEKSLIPDIEKAISKAGLGLNPVTSGDVVRVPLPPLTEERRKEFVKQVKADAETARVAIRNARRDANHKSKELLKASDISEDDDRRNQDKIQNLTDRFIADIDALAVQKEKELMEV